MKPAIFLDRDGTIIDDCGDIDEIKDVVFFDYTIPALLKLQERYSLFIITNQSGISKGFISESKVIELHRYLIDTLLKNGIVIDEICYCPHADSDKCLCRKPKPYFINMLKEKYNIDLKNSFVIGDHPSDMKLAENAGCSGVFVLTGHGDHHKDDIGNNFKICADLLAAKEYILNS
jgi:D-glycero-D-manno-heptose 1,7-bisphosphate phosphatase